MVHAVGKDLATDDPPHSRLFVVYNRKDPVSDEELRADFGQYGEIQDIFVVRDKSSGDPKGVAYVKFAKMSHAALAMEKLNNQPIKDKSGTYKIYIAKTKGEARGEEEDPGRFSRLFVMVPKTAAEKDISEYFSKFGEIQSVKLLRNRGTNESKGIGYVTYNRIYEAALAVEEGENEEGYKAVIARPKEKHPHANPAPSHEPRPLMSKSGESRPPMSNRAPRIPPKDFQSTNENFTAFVSVKLSKDQIFRLFDIAPGLRNIEIVSQNMYRSEVVATYNSILAAEYALNKLHGVEYPFGEFISVESKAAVDKSKTFSRSSPSTSLSSILSASMSGGKRDYHGDHMDYKTDSPPRSSDSSQDVNQKLSALSKALKDATALLTSAGLSTESLNVKQDNSDSSWPTSSSQYCDFPVPPRQTVHPITEFHEGAGMRLFFVGHPAAPPVEALYDVYCRFGNFAGASVAPRKNYGYLYFLSPESAYKARQATDDKIIAGVSIKVLKAEQKEADSSHKRKRVEH